MAPAHCQNYDGGMSAFDLAASLERARRRDAGTRRRSDRGQTRFGEEVTSAIAQLFSGQERPSFSAVHRELVEQCERHGWPAPSRATLYNAVDVVPVPRLRWADLPDAVTRSLYNLAPGSEQETIPGDVVVFYAFNYGEPRALSFASGLPWLCLIRAERRPGWRPKSRALLRAVMRYRGIR